MKTVLIIEDDVTIARIYQGLLRMEGVEAEVVTDGEAALNRLRCRRPDLVLLDVMLPKMSGIEVLKQIRMHPAIKDLPVIVFSNAFLSAADQEVCRTGPTERLAKCETSPKQLLRVIRTKLGVETPGSLGCGELTAPGENAKSVSNTPAAQRNGELSEEQLLDRSRQALLNDAPRRLQTLRNSLQALTRGATPADRRTALTELQRSARILGTAASLASLVRVARMAGSIEALTRELLHRPDALNDSSLRTLAQALDFLAVLFEEAGKGDWDLHACGIVLVVDDDAISRRAVCSALTRAHVPCIELGDANLALAVLETNTFNLLFLDVDMPGMSGFELCQKIRAVGRNKATPAVFVTGLTDFGSRTLSIRSGGNDVIAKPFVGLELTVKALLYLLRSRSAIVESARPPVAPKPSPSLQPQPLLC